MKGRKEDKLLRKRKFLLKYGLWAGITLLFIDFICLFFLGDYLNLSIFADALNSVIASYVAYMAFFCYLHTPKKLVREKKFLLYLLIAFIFRLMGEMLWAYYDLFGKFMPAFSFADLAWMLSNIMIIVAFEYKLHKSFIIHRKTALTIFGLVLSVLAVLFIYGIYLKLPVLEVSTGLAYLVNESYVLFDMFILILVMTSMFFSVEKNKKSFILYLFIALGSTATTIYDFFFANMYLKGTYLSGGKLEFLYFSSYFLIYCAFYLKYKHLEGWNKVR